MEIRHEFTTIFPVTDFAPTEMLAKPANPLKATAEAKFWAKFSVVAVHKQPGASSAVEFASSGDVYAVTASTRVLLYDARTHELQHSISRFKDVAYGASFRHDAQLIVAGGAHPLVQVFHVSSCQHSPTHTHTQCKHAHTYT
jgi:U3 small nucleolar RNA-associated protein 15